MEYRQMQMKGKWAGGGKKYMETFLAKPYALLDLFPYSY